MVEGGGLLGHGAPACPRQTQPRPNPTATESSVPSWTARVGSIDTTAVRLGQPLPFGFGGGGAFFGLGGTGRPTTLLGGFGLGRGFLIAIGRPSIVQNGRADNGRRGIRFRSRRRGGHR